MAKHTKRIAAQKAAAPARGRGGNSPAPFNMENWGDPTINIPPGLSYAQRDLGAPEMSRPFTPRGEAAFGEISRTGEEGSAPPVHVGPEAGE